MYLDECICLWGNGTHYLNCNFDKMLSFFEHLCNRVQWSAALSPVYLVAVPLPPTLSGRQGMVTWDRYRSCSAFGQCHSGPLPQASNCQWVTVSGAAQPLVGGAVCPSHKQPTVSKRPLVAHSASGQRSGGCQPESEVRGRSRLHQASPSLGSVGELGVPENRLGTVSCRSPETLPRSPTGQAQPLRRWWTSAQSLSLQTKSSSRLPGAQFVGPASAIQMALDMWGPVGSQVLTPSVMTAGQCLGTWPWGGRQLSCASSQPGPGPQRVKVVPRTSPFLVRAENNIRLVVSYRNMVTWPWPDLKNKGSDTNKFTTTNYAPPTAFLEKGFAESFQGVWGF